MRTLFFVACLALVAAAAAQPAGACDRSFRPCCGADGVTYKNPCLARAAGATVIYMGPCGQPESGSGGGEGAPAPDGADAAVPGEPAPDTAAGAPAPAAAPVATACPLIYKPVCGADGKTYSNGCLAKSAKTLVKTLGECAGDAKGASEAFAAPMEEEAGAAAAPSTTKPGTGEPGSSASLNTVPPAKADDAAPGASAAASPASKADDAAPGASAAASPAPPPRPRPVACALIYKPVCGSNGKTYGNECMARAAQASIASTGECATGGPSDPDALEPEPAAPAGMMGGGGMMMSGGGGGGMMGPGGGMMAANASSNATADSAVPPRRLPAIEEPSQEPSQRP